VSNVSEDDEDDEDDPGVLIIKVALVLSGKVTTGAKTKVEPRSNKITTKTLSRPDRFGGSGGISTDGITVACFLDSGPSTRIHACTSRDDAGLVDLGTLDPPNDATRSSFAYATNADGSVVVGVSDIPGGTSNQHAFRWTKPDGMADLGSANGAAGYSRAFATNAAGNAVVGESDFASGARRAFRWTADGGFQDLDPSGSGHASGVSADGGTVVGQNKSHVFRWTQAGGMQDLGALAGRSGATATGVSANGKVVVGLSARRGFSFGNSVGWDFDSSDTRAFRWTAATGMQDLTQVLADTGVDMTGVTLVAALAISPDGQFIGGAMTTPTTEPNEYHGFLAQVCDDSVDRCVS
jgi:probable HAF family extracellular repeat protein